MRNKPTLRSLANRLERAATSEPRVEAIAALASTGDPAAIHVLLPYLDTEGPVAVACIEALLSFGARVVFPARRLLDADDAQTRRNAALVLATFGDARACAILAEDFRDFLAGPLATARWLARAGRPGLVAMLTHAAYDWSAYADAVALELARGAGEELLRAFVDDARKDTRLYAARALEERRRIRARPVRANAP